MIPALAALFPPFAALSGLGGPLPNLYADDDVTVLTEDDDTTPLTE